MGSDVTWTYEVTNDGDVAMSNIAVSDDQGVVVDCGGVTTLAAGESVTCTASGTSAAGQYTNVGSVSASYTDADGDVADRADSDTSNYFGADPEVGITKTFADDSVIAGGTASSFDLVVSNDGNVDLSGVSVTDTVDADLVVASVSSATADCANSAGQVIDCVVDLAVGESATVTVTFAVDSVTVETLGVSNTADATNTYTDDSANSVDLADDDTDTIDILTDINLSIVKTFDPNDVPQGTLQTFTLEVSNAGPSDAVDVSVSDVVDDTLAVQGASVTSGAGDCAASAGQTVDCTVQVPAGESVTVTVSYLVAPFLGDDGSTTGGDTFRFVFANGDVLEGSTATGEVLLNGVDVSAQTTIISGLSRNDVVFDPDGPGGEPAIELHLSCSDAFTGGYGTSGGPVEGVNSPDYQIAFFSIARYNNNGFIKDCGNVTNPFDVDNTAEATGVDSFGTDTVSDTATVTVSPGITLDRLQTAGKRLTVRLTNLTGVDKSIESISVLWPDSNGDLRKIRLDDATTWTGNEAPTSAVLDAADAGWVGGTLMTGEGILRLDFGRKVAKNGYTVRVTFEDGTFLDISK